MNYNPRWWLVVALSVLVAFMLAALPMPAWADSWRPAWVPMVLIYWCMALPGRVGVLTAWWIGLLLDVLNGTLLGQHAFGLAAVAYLAVLYHQRVRVFPLFQQALVVGTVVFLYLLVMLGIYNGFGSVKYGFGYLLGAISSAVLWPWVFIILRDLRRKANVA
jgi:rod shape-determining protein MreD